MVREPGTLRELVALFIEIINLAVPLVFAAIFLVVIWKVVDTWILNSHVDGKIKEGKQFVSVGIIALVIGATIWGILALLRSSLLGV